jgi:NADPH:quinone reductase-like Zn-dependent oxidoreductase
VAEQSSLNRVKVGLSSNLIIENTIEPGINHAVRYDHFGHRDVLYIAELLLPSPKAAEILVKIKTAGINPGEAAIREGLMAKQFPSGQGADFAGIIASVGSGVTKFNIGDEVLGFTNDRSGQADYIAVNADQLVARPAGVSWEAAGGLFIFAARLQFKKPGFQVFGYGPRSFGETSG